MGFSQRFAAAICDGGRRVPPQSAGGREICVTLVDGSVEGGAHIAGELICEDLGSACLDAVEHLPNDVPG